MHRLPILQRFLQMRRLFIVLLVVALLSGMGIGLVSGGGEDDKRARRPQRPPVVAANGATEGARPEVPVRPEVVGTITAIAAREGTDVAAGGVLVELENATQQAQVALAEAEVAVAEAALERLRNGERPEKREAVAAAMRSKQALHDQARAVSERSQRVGITSVSKEQAERENFMTLVTLADWKAAQAEYAVVQAPARQDEERGAEARVRSAQAQLSKARADLAKTQLRAPFACRVLRVHAEVGQLVGPASVQPLLVIADVSRLRVRAFVEELHVFQVHHGQRAVVTADGLPGREFVGTVAQVLPGMGRRNVQSEAPGEYKDVFFREVLIDLDDGRALPLNLRVRTWIDVPATP